MGEVTNNEMGGVVMYWGEWVVPDVGHKPRELGFGDEAFEIADAKVKVVVANARD